MTNPVLPLLDAPGIMRLTRQLGDYFEREPEPELPTIAAPTRPSRGRWSEEQWAEMQEIYEGKKL